MTVSDEKDRLRVLAVCAFPVEAAATRFRLAQFIEPLKESGIDLELGMWIRDPENGTPPVRSDVSLAILATFRREGIEIPFPQREIRLAGRSPTEADLIKITSQSGDSGSRSGYPVESTNSAARPAA